MCIRDTTSAVTSVVSEPFVDSEGREALRITIVIAPKFSAKIKGDKSLDTLVEIQNRLRKAGEERFPLVEYATEKELKESGSS
jgi:hypothetical protein